MNTDIFTQPMTTVTRDRLLDTLGKKFDPKTAAKHAAWVVTHNMSEGLGAKKITSLETLEDWTAPVEAPKQVAPDFEHGALYMVEGDVYRVKRSARGYFYAEKLEGTRFEYAPGDIRRIHASDRLTLEQAKAYGVRTGVCGCCGRELTNPESIDRGIGPVCASKHF